MSSAEDIFASMNVEEPHIVIGSDRVITVPEQLKRIAVQFDHNIETVTFDCPRYWDGHDMSTMTVYVNYMRADGKPGSYKADNVRIDESDDAIMHFDWTITRNASEVNGQLAVLVCVRSIDDEGNEQNHWNSELNRDMYISEGMDCCDVIVNLHPDVITQILTKLDTIYAEAEKIANKLTEYTEVGTDEPYYSAKAVNEMFVATGEIIEIISKENNEKFATKDYVNELIGGIENGSY